MNQHGFETDKENELLATGGGVGVLKIKAEFTFCTNSHHVAYLKISGIQKRSKRDPVRITYVFVNNRNYSGIFFRFRK